MHRCHFALRVWKRVDGQVPGHPIVTSTPCWVLRSCWSVSGIRVKTPEYVLL
jgi:hypothetical protein